MTGALYAAGGGVVLAGLIAAGVALGGMTATPEPAPLAAGGQSLPPLTGAEGAGGMDRATLRAEVRAYLLEEPEVLMEAIAVLEQRREIQQQEAEIDLVRRNMERLSEDGYSYVGGNPEGSLTVIEFLDYRCGFCKRAHPEVEALLASDDDIRYIVKEYPILGPESEVAARAAMAVLMTEGEAAYKTYHDALMEFGGNMTEGVIMRLAERSGIDVAALRRTMAEEGPEITARIAQNRALAQTLGINGTPSFVIGDTIVRGYLPLQQMREVVALAREVQAAEEG
ncbi:MAG: DsbA family protein [Pseudomonadota bacterium]